MLKTKNLGIQMKTTETSFTNRMQKMEERTLGTGDTIKKWIYGLKKM